MLEPKNCQLEEISSTTSANVAKMLIIYGWIRLHGCECASLFLSSFYVLKWLQLIKVIALYAIKSA